MTVALKQRLAYADFLRVIAMVAVVIIHISGGWFNSTVFNTGYWWLYNLLDSLVRWCVPLFFLLSGMFFLDPSKHLTWKDLFCKYLPRICVALVVWTVLYVFLDNWPGKANLSLSWLHTCLKDAVYGGTYYHLWYLYTIAGLYLITPILRVFVRSAQKRDFQYFLLLCFVFASLFPTLLLLRPSQTIQTYLFRLDVRLVLGYVGLFVAGYYLKTFPPTQTIRRVIYGLGLAGAVITVGGTYLLSHRAGVADVSLMTYFTPNVVFMAAALFLLFQNHGEQLGQSRWVSRVSGLSFGVYLVHPFFITVLSHYGYGPGTTACSPLLAIPLQLMVVLSGSLVISWCISKIPVVNRYLS